MTATSITYDLNEVSPLRRMAGDTTVAHPFLPSPTTVAVNPTCFHVDDTLNPATMSISTLAAAISQ